MFKGREADKGQQYIQQLDAARCGGRWQEIPELTRKISKHASHRNCLIYTAQTEQRILDSHSPHPSTASTYSERDLSEAAALLDSTSSKEKSYPEDALQAQILAAWIRLTLGDPGAALATVPESLETTLKTAISNKESNSKWTQIVLIKAAYIKGVALENTDKGDEALLWFERVLPQLFDYHDLVGEVREFQCWTERLLSRYCLLTSKYVKSNNSKAGDLGIISTLEPESILKPFRAWAGFWGDNFSHPGRQQPTIGADVKCSRRQVWSLYYTTLSVLVQGQILEPIFETRLRQFQELKKVEAVHEQLLLKETTFPKADETTADIDVWVEQVVLNWRVFLNYPWTSTDLGAGGKAKLGRGVSEILYRAATRTFHSTQILRHLSTVHCSLAEFQLGSKAFDTYLTITGKGLARVEKSGKSEAGLDEQATILETTAAGILTLCRYGKRVDIERAQAVAMLLHTWLDKAQQGAQSVTKIGSSTPPDGSLDDAARSNRTRKGQSLARAYHAIGTAKAYWARFTYQTELRTSLQTEAIQMYREALNVGGEIFMEVQLALASSLAESRDIDGSITAVKQAISIGAMPVVRGETETDYDHTPENRGLLLRCWHLLVLLLSVRQDFTNALASCEAAFEIYGSEDMLIKVGQSSSHMDNLPSSERVCLLELKLTHLALIEYLEGPESALQMTGELLALFAKCFKIPAKNEIREPDVRPSTSTTSVLGAQRSVRGSILGLPRDRRRSKLVFTNAATSDLPTPEKVSEDHDMDGAQECSSDDRKSKLLPQVLNHNESFLGRHHSNKLQKRPSKRYLTTTKQSRAASPSNMPTSDSSHHIGLHLPHILHHHNHHIGGDHKTNGTTQRTAKDTTNGESLYSADEIGIAMTHDMPSAPGTPRAIDERLPATISEKLSSNIDDQSPVQPKSELSRDARSPLTSNISASSKISEPHYPPHIQSRHLSALLVKLWLFIAALYRRSASIADAKGAIAEARSHVEIIEKNIATHDNSSAECFTEAGYGRMPSCGQLWADVFAEQGALYTEEGESDQALASYEVALFNDPSHPAATIGLSEILLSAFETSLEPPKELPSGMIPTLAPLPTPPPENKTEHISNADLLAQLSARDRVYGLLSTLTKSGQGWDNSEAWSALATAYELSGQVDKAKEALWWVVELEEGRPIRPWSSTL